VQSGSKIFRWNANMKTMMNLVAAKFNHLQYGKVLININIII
jgi:hypothetical protein